MKAKLTRPDGVSAEVDGTPEEVAAFLAAFVPPVRVEVVPTWVPTPLPLPLPVWIWSGTLPTPAGAAAVNDGGAKPPLYPPAGVGG